MRTTLRTPFAHDDGTHTHNTHKEEKTIYDPPHQHFSLASDRLRPLEMRWDEAVTVEIPPPLLYSRPIATIPPALHIPTPILKRREDTFVIGL